MSLKEKEKLRNALVEGNLLILQDFLHEDTDYVFTVKFEVIFILFNLFYLICFVLFYFKRKIVLVCMLLVGLINKK